jgi:hypothetical protein
MPAPINTAIAVGKHLIEMPVGMNSIVEQDSSVTGTVTTYVGIYPTGGDITTAVVYIHKITEVTVTTLVTTNVKWGKNSDGTYKAIWANRATLTY